MNCKAMTTIELLVATALAAVLMIGVLHATGSIRPELDGRGHTPTRRWPANLVRLLQWDLANAHWVIQEENKLTIVGHNALNRGDFGWKRNIKASSTHRPVTVEYQLWPGKEHDDGNWLIRRQTHMTELTNRRTWAEVVAWGVEGLALRQVDGTIDAMADLPLGGEDDSVEPALGVEDADTAEPVTGVEGDWLDGNGSIPRRVRLVVTMAGDQEPGIDSLIVLR